MGRSKAHNFITVADVGTPKCVGIYRDETGVERYMFVSEMSVTDLVRVAKLAAPGVNGRTMNQSPGFQDVLKSWLVGDRDSLPVEWFEVPADKPSPFEAVGAIPVAKPTSNGSESELDLVRRILGGTVDADQVRRIVAEAIKDIKPQVTTITVNGREPVKVDGRTHKLLKDMLDVLSRKRPVFLSGEPGSGKSHLAHQAADAFQVPFYGISCNVQMSKGDLLGYRDAMGEYRRTEFREAYEHGGVFLFDEMDKSNPNVLATLNFAIENGSCSFPDGRVSRHEDFYLVAAGNTWGTGATQDFVGSLKLDAATMNRYIKLHCERDPKLETDIITAIVGDGGKLADWQLALSTVRTNVNKHGLRVFCTMRDAINGAYMIDAGWSPKKVLQSTVTAGLDDGQVRKVMEGV